MSDNSKKLSWLSAFLMLLGGTAFALGKNHRWKSLWMLSAVIFPILGPIVNSMDSQNYAGALPPEVPIIKTTGTFVRKVERIGLKEVPYILFAADNGDTYRTEHRVAPGILDDLGRQTIPVKVYVEGFLLKNGKGSFYPLKLASISGVDLVPPNQLMTQLSIGRNPFYSKKIILLLIVIFISWSFSIFYAAQLRSIISKENHHV